MVIFIKGDAEKAQGLPFSPLCDRNTTVIPESQVGKCGTPFKLTS